MNVSANETTLILPCYNEEKRLPSTLQAAKTFGFKDVIVVDDGSSDRTRRVATEAGVRVEGYQQNRGKGHAIMHGIETSQTRYALIADADQSASFGEYRALAKTNAPIAVGSRALPGSVVEARHVRVAAGRVGNWVARLVTGIDVKDTQCGFKLIDTQRAEKILEAIEEDGFAWDIELLYLAKKHGVDVVEVPITWSHVPGSKVRFSSYLSVLKSLYRIRRRHG
jgi:dolichyl-phosphate beta-glucosyltransferase